MSASQDQVMRGLLIKLELLSHGATASLSFTTAGGERDHGCPPGEGSPPHEVWRGRYNAQGDDVGRGRVIRGAREELRMDAHSAALKVSPESLADEDKRICREGEGFTADEVALSFHCAPKRVRLARQGEGRDPVWGRVVGPLVDGSVRVRVVELRAQNLSQRQIASKLGVSQPMVCKILRSVA